MMSKIFVVEFRSSVSVDQIRKVIEEYAGTRGKEVKIHTVVEDCTVSWR